MAIPMRRSVVGGGRPRIIIEQVTRAQRPTYELKQAVCAATNKQKQTTRAPRKSRAHVKVQGLEVSSHLPDAANRIGPESNLTRLITRLAIPISQKT